MRLILITGLCLVLGSPASAQTTSRLSCGLRVGYGDSDYKGVFREAEISVRYERVPWWRSGRRWTLRLGVEALAGAVGNDTDQSALIGCGPSLALGMWRDRISFDTGSTLAMMTDHTFGRISLGSPVQFITHWRLRVRPIPSLGIAYRYQHMSNGGLGLDNPGLNLHMLEVTVGL